MRSVVLVLKPIRFEVIAMAAASLFVAAFALFVTQQLWALGDLRDCLRPLADGQLNTSPGCAGAVDSFWHLHNGLGQRAMSGMSVLPYVVGAVLGVSIVAREIEGGTAPLAWALTGSRTRWLVARLIRVVPVIFLIMAPAVVASEVLEVRLEPFLDPGASFADWGSRGFPLFAYALAATAIGVLAGLLIGRTLPAIIVAGALCIVVQSADHPALRRVLSTQAEPTRGVSTANTIVSSADLFTRVQAVDDQGNPIEETGGAGGGSPDLLVVYVIPGRRALEVELLESGLMLIGAAAATGVALLVVRNRRPY